jgi:hypothetical protein
MTRAGPDRCAVAVVGSSYTDRSEVVMSDSTLVVVGTFLSAVDAEVALSALDARGIEAMVRSDDCGGLRPHLWMHGVELLVREDDAVRAAEILDEAPPASPIDTPAE